MTNDLMNQMGIGLQIYPSVTDQPVTDQPVSYSSLPFRPGPLIDKLLAAAPEPLTDDHVSRICAYSHLKDDEGQEEKGDGRKGPEGDGDDTPIAPSQHPRPPALPTELIEAFDTVLEYARRDLPREVSGIATADLQAIEHYVAELLAVLTKGNQVQRIANRAEATSKQRARKVRA